MNDFGNAASVFICIVGGLYAFQLLVDCCRQLRRGESRDKPAGRAVSARIEWLCQLFIAATFLIVTGAVLIAAAQQSLPAPASLRASESGTEPTRSVQIPGMRIALPASRLTYDTSLPGSPLIGADLSNLPITDADVRALAHHAPQLEFLILAETNITDEGLASVAELHSLEVLNLAATRIADSGLVHVAQLKSLEILSMAGTRITSDGLGHLGRMTRLQMTYLPKTAVTEDALESLKQLPRLKHVHVQ
jgi:hypothetical protein